jgi:hypothetical protein
MKRLLIYNAVALIALYGVWIWGWYMSEYWMHVTDIGAPWSWLAIFFASSLLALRKLGSKVEVVLKSLAGASVTWIAFWILVLFSMPIFDPMF